jgi:hypothetical protein
MPYIITKERPFYLHAIMIHDGVAEQGHYFTYVYDRVKKIWWKLNDHNVSMELEEDVFETAFGDATTHKSACNMIYISKHIADQIDKYKKPLFTEQHASNFKIEMSLKRQIQEGNYTFSFEQQQYIVKQCAININNHFNHKINKLDEKQQSLMGIEEIKLHSFYHYLKLVGFKGFAKWMILNQCFKEEHPQKFDLLTMVQAPELKKDDLVYQELQKFYKEKFIDLTDRELVSLQTKQNEFKELLKKAEIIVFIMQNLNAQNIRHIFQAIRTFGNRTKTLEQTIAQYKERIADYDQITKEVMQVFIIRLIINMVLKARTNKRDHTLDALQSAQLCGILALHFMDQKLVYHKQFEKSFKDTCIYIQQNYSEEDRKPWVQLYKLYTKKELSNINILNTDDYERSDLQPTLVQRLKQIDCTDMMEYRDVFDPESTGFKYA